MKNEKLAVTQQKFQEFYKENLQDIYENLERVRQKNLRNLFRNIIGIICVGSAFAALFYFDVLTEKVLQQRWFSLLCSVLLLIAGGLIYCPFMEYNGQTKSRTMNKILSFWGKFKYYNGSDLIDSTEIKKSELFTYFNLSQSADAFWGEHKSVDIDVSEHDLRVHGNKGDTVIFKGVLIKFEFPQKFSGKTVVLNKGRNWNFIMNNPLLMVVLGILLEPPVMVYYYYFTEPSVPTGLLFTWLPVCLPLFVIGIAYKIYRRFHPKKATAKVVLEGLSFMRNWRILTDNQIEARYILTPLFMEKMLEIKRLFHGKHIDFSFFNNKLLIAVHTRKNMFETTSLFVPALSYHKVRDVVSQLHSIFAIIDVILSETGKKLH